MELTLWVEQRDSAEVGENVRGALKTFDENADHIKQGLARFRGRGVEARVNSKWLTVAFDQGQSSRGLEQTLMPWYQT